MTTAQKVATADNETRSSAKARDQKLKTDHRYPCNYLMGPEDRLARVELGWENFENFQMSTDPATGDASTLNGAHFGGRYVIITKEPSSKTILVSGQVEPRLIKVAWQWELACKRNLYDRHRALQQIFQLRNEVSAEFCLQIQASGTCVFCVSVLEN